MPARVVTLDESVPIWERFYTVAPLVLIGSREPDGTYDLAPKHMALPLGWGNYFGFVCSPSHGTYCNIVRERAFTVTYPHPSQIVLTSLAATPRDHDDVKPALRVLSTFPAQRVDGLFVADGYLFLECTLDRVVDGFGVNSLIAGRVIAAHADEVALRTSEREDEEVLRAAPPLAYVAPGRYAEIRQAHAFPFPAGFRR